MITRFTLQFEGCYELTDADITHIVEKLNDMFSGGTFKVDAMSINKHWRDV